MTFAVGQRVRFREPCIWPERGGQAGVVVRPRSDGVYPQPAPSEVIVLLDSDKSGYGWTCVASIKSLEAI